MESLKGFLARYTNLSAPEQSVRAAFVQAVHDVVEISLEERAVVVKKNAVAVHAPAPIKSEIRLYQSDILARVGELLGDTQRVRAIY